MAAGSPVFSALSEATRQGLISRARTVELAAGARLFSRGDPSDAVYVLLSGELEVSLPAEGGREVWLARLGPGALLGEMGVLDAGPRSADVTAVRRSRLLRIGRAVVLDALSSEPAAALVLLQVMAGRLRDADAMVRRRGTADLAERLAAALIQSTAPLTQSQAELGRLVGASREAVNRKLAEWRERGWVSRGASGLKVDRPDVLRQLADPERLD